MNWIVIAFFATIGVCVGLFVVRVAALAFIALLIGGAEAAERASSRRAWEKGAPQRQLLEIEACWKKIDKRNADRIDLARRMYLASKTPKRLPSGTGDVEYDMANDKWVRPLRILPPR